VAAKQPTENTLEREANSINVVPGDRRDLDVNGNNPGVWVTALIVE
jgi:hypothetical protein